MRLTAMQERILEAFAQRFPESAAASGGRPMILRPDSSFPDLIRGGPDQLETFLEAAESLAGHGVIQLRWKRHRHGEELVSMVLVDPAKLFSLLGRDSPLDLATTARQAARQIASQGTQPGEKALFSWMADNLDAADAARGIDARLVVDLSRLNLYASQPPSLTVRALSISLFSDSKRLEAVLHACKPLLSKAGGMGIPRPRLDYLERAFPDTLIAGRLRLQAGDGSVLVDNPSGLSIGLPESTIASATYCSSLETGPKQVLGIENKESFFVLAKAQYSGKFWQSGLLVYVGGHPNRAVQRLYKILASSGFSLFHAGDLDPDGILILQELADAAGKPVLPCRMDVATFDRYEAYSRPLDRSMMIRAAQIRDSTRGLPGIEELIQRILGSGCGIEQEIVDYCD